MKKIICLNNGEINAIRDVANILAHANDGDGVYTMFTTRDLINLCDYLQRGKKTDFATAFKIFTTENINK